MRPLTEVEQNLQAHMIEKQRLAESHLLLRLYRALIENPDLSSGLRAASVIRHEKRITDEANRTVYLKIPLNVF